jgi:hypothetical protein
LNMETFHLMSTSHPSELQIENIAGKQVLKWHFKNINLPDSTANEPQSHGYIKFKIKHKTGIAEGTVIQNFADIYFDFNEPVRTNTTLSNITDYQFPQALVDFCSMVRKAQAGENQTICKSQTTLSGNIPNVGTGKWTVVQGTALFEDENDPQTTVTGLAYGENILEWNITSEKCNSQSQVKITRLAVLEASVSIETNIQEAVCLGTTFTFTATGFNGGNAPIYTWKVNGVKKGANNPVLSINTLQNGDKVKLEMISAEPCVTPSVAISNEITISIKPQPTQPAIEFLPERQLQSTVEGSSYDWFYAGNLLNEHTRSIAYTENTEGNYQVKVWWDDCVSEISGVFNTRISAIDSPSVLGNISLYPHPHQGDFTLKITQAKGKNLGLSIYTPSGQKVWEQSYPQIGDTFEQNIQLPSLPKGMYLLHIQGEKGKVTKSMVVW